MLGLPIPPVKRDPANIHSGRVVGGYSYLTWDGGMGKIPPLWSTHHLVLLASSRMGGCFM